MLIGWFAYIKTDGVVFLNKPDFKRAGVFLKEAYRRIPKRRHPFGIVEAEESDAGLRDESLAARTRITASMISGAALLAISQAL